MSYYYYENQIEPNYRVHMGHSPAGGVPSGVPSPAASLLGQLGGILAGTAGAGVPGGLLGQVLTQPQPSVGGYAPYYPSPTPQYFPPLTGGIPEPQSGTHPKFPLKITVQDINNQIYQLWQFKTGYESILSRPKPLHLTDAQYQQYLNYIRIEHAKITAKIEILMRMIQTPFQQIGW
jgi:hypothetical protein